LTVHFRYHLGKFECISWQEQVALRWDDDDDEDDDDVPFVLDYMLS
jgi:hypothetical protein